MKPKNKSTVSEVAYYNFLKQQEGEKLFKIGIKLYENNQHERALTFLQQALKISQDIGYWYGVASCLYNIGMAFDFLKRYDLAFEYFQLSLKAAKKSKDNWTQLKSLKKIGDFYLYKSKYKLAENAYTESLNIANKKEELSQEKIGLLDRLGNIFCEQGKYKGAENYHLQQLSMAKSLGNAEIESIAFLNLGNVAQLQGNYELAISYYYNCLDITRCINNPHLEANCLGNLGNTFHSFCQEEKAIEYHQKSRKLAIEINDIDQEYRTLSNLGLIYESLGQYQTAKEFQQQSLSILEIHTNPDLKEKAQTLGNLGNIHKNLGQYDLAIKYHKQSLKIKQEIEYPMGEAQSLINLGIAYKCQNQYDIAIENYNASLEISRDIKNPVEEFRALINLGNIYCIVENYQLAKDFYNEAINIRKENLSPREEGYLFSGLSHACYYLKEYEQAFDYCQKQLDIAKQIGEVILEVCASINLGSWYYKNNQLLESENILKEAICLHELLRNGLNYNDQVMLFDTQVDVYFLLQEVLVKQNKYSEALEIAERGRARAFIELLYKRFVTIPTKFDNQLPSLEKIKRISLDYNATIVEYSIIYSYALYIWIIKPSGEIIFRNIDLNPLLEDGTSLREIAKEANQEIDNSSWTDARYYVKKLYEYLILPIQDVLPTDPESQVIFIPQHELYLIPFPALQDSTGKFLIEQHTISIAPSIQSLEFTQNQKQRIRSKVWEDKDSYIDALVVGNPTMPIIPFSKPPKQLGSLPHSQEEAEEIAALFKTEAIIGNRATKLHIIELLPKAKLIHLATHGECSLTDQSGIPGAIALAPSDKDSGFLTSGEILELELNAELVVLSGCNTGLGAIRNDGIVSLSYCLFFAGIPSVIGSLWEVNDNPTKLLMIDFYQNLQNKMNKAQALRQAMLTLIEQYRNCPKMWAAFTLIGEL
ncbi:MAG: CHAT domain-containing protein [Dolichospermum sp. LBC05a]|nr:CHAT domain-containing protein [Dolichospermum sp. OL01]MCO5797615.1 CHAT domain-containing protein [Dolichospermum sp. OL03]MCS6280397.1 CHAT domain-containing protein [Dolichospermum sp.]QSV59128.1 MAG: CHAT domain-containing protein [Dolichospermum sp. LBC05a]